MKKSLSPTAGSDFVQTAIEEALRGLAIPSLEDFTAIIDQTAAATDHLPSDASGLAFVAIAAVGKALPPETPADLAPWVYDRIAETFNSLHPGCTRAALIRRLQSAFGQLPLGVLNLTRGMVLSPIPAGVIYDGLLEHRRKYAEPYPLAPTPSDLAAAGSGSLVSRFGPPDTRGFVIFTIRSPRATMIATRGEYDRLDVTGVN